MTKLQFRVLYHQFLSRIVDVELLAAHAQGDASTLLGQFAALLIFISLGLAMAAIGFADAKLPAAEFVIASWSAEHFLIATTMLVVGLFAVLRWESTFPDRRDVLVLAPLPVRARTLFLAKVAAAATALSLTGLALHLFAGLIWPFVLNRQTPAVSLESIPATGGFLGLIRLFAVYWITMLASGAFIFCCVLGVQGLAAQLLPRRLFLRASSFLQLAAFCLLVSVYFLQPMLAMPSDILSAQSQGPLAWSPSYWFLGLFQQLNGSPALAPLATRAWIGLAMAIAGTAAAYALSYFRTLRKIAEEPDIVSGASGAHWLPEFGTPIQTAIVHFSIRTLFRSRQHRVVLAFYLGIAFAAIIVFLKSPVSSSILLMGYCVLGIRVVFSLPMDLRANWIFRITPLRGGAECLIARRRSLLVLSVLPVWLGSAVLFLSIWPWRAALGHLALLALLGVIVSELCLTGVPKIPFTCSWLPGKSNFHITFWMCSALLIQIVSKAAEYERRLLANPSGYATLLAILIVVAVCARWRTRSADAALVFEEVPSWKLTTLELP
jgi:hypothetical protein